MTLWGLTPPTFSHLTQEGNSMSNRIVINVAPDMNMVVAQVSPEEVRVSLLCESRTNWVAHNWMDEDMELDAVIAGKYKLVQDVFALADDSVSYTIYSSDLGVAIVQAKNYIRRLAKRQELPSENAQAQANAIAERRRLAFNR
tara:strand:- start:1098 stop:1526 length:429 start_codon:yes stop_codon:yes gene_type:complete